MTAPFTKVAILFTGTALLFNSLRDTHTQLEILCTGTALLFTMHTNTADYVHRDWFFVYYSARRTELLIMCTGTAFLSTSARDCIRCQWACAVFFVSESVRRTERCRLCAQGQRLCALAYVIVCDLQQPVQLLLTTGARRHRFIYAKPYRLMAMHGQNDKKIYRHSVDRKT